jgi:hypothetical protein
MTSYRCENCDKVEVVDMIPRRGKVCFGCHLRGIRIGFAHGKENFHGDTIKQRQDLQMKQASDAGIVAEPVGSRWI